jgi:dynein heavy chain
MYYYYRGHESLNLSSLSIPDFIEDCMREISKFRDIKKKLDKNALMIEDIVKNIENALILKEFNFQERKDNN